MSPRTEYDEYVDYDNMYGSRAEPVTKILNIDLVCGCECCGKTGSDPDTNEPCLYVFSRITERLVCSYQCARVLARLPFVDLNGEIGDPKRHH